MYEAQSREYEIVFVGSGTVPQDWYKAEGVHVLGEMSPDKLTEIYKTADIFVSPTKGEIFTLVMQEAFASGLPVVTTDEEEYKTYNLDTEGIVFCTQNKDSLRSILQSLVHDEEKLAYMSTYSRKLAEKYFDWDKNVAPSLDMYTDIQKKSKKVFVTTSWDDGHKLDMRVAGLLEQYGIKGTFYISPKNHEFKKDDALTELEVCTLARDYEIGAHTITHRSLTQIREQEVEKEVVESKKYLEKLLERDVLSFCYPRGKYSKKIIASEKDAGFTYARTVKRFVTKQVDDKRLTSPTSIDTYDHYSDVWHVLKFARFHPIAFFKYFRKWDEIAIEMFNRVKKDGGVFHLWGHSWQIEEHGDWRRLDRVLKHIGGHSDVEYVENKELYG